MFFKKSKKTKSFELWRKIGDMESAKGLILTDVLDPQLFRRLAKVLCERRNLACVCLDGSRGIVADAQILDHPLA